MTNLKLQALQLVLSIDSQLEPLEDTLSFPKSNDQQRYCKLKKLIVRAESRYYRRSKTVPNSWSLVSKIVKNATAIPEVVAEATIVPEISNIWMEPYL